MSRWAAKRPLGFGNEPRLLGLLRSPSRHKAAPTLTALLTKKV